MDKGNLAADFNLLSASVSVIETSQLICCANQLTGFYMRSTLALNGLIFKSNLLKSFFRTWLH